MRVCHKLHPQYSSATMPCSHFFCGKSAFIGMVLERLDMPALILRCQKQEWSCVDPCDAWRRPWQACSKSIDLKASRKITLPVPVVWPDIQPPAKVLEQQGQFLCFCYTPKTAEFRKEGKLIKAIAQALGLACTTTWICPEKERNLKQDERGCT